MKNIFIGVAFVAIVGVVGFYIFNAYIYEQEQAFAASDYKNGEYIIDGARVKLKNGVAETPAAPGSASKVTTRYFGNEVIQDLNNDGKQDVTFLLTQETGGSGTFYYVAAALKTDRGYVGSEGLYLGDRIAPQISEKGPLGSVIINYADRKAGEDFSVQPSVAKSLRLKFDADYMQFGEVAQNFEGEADPSMMRLDMKSWTWTVTSYTDGTEVFPRSVKPFVLTFTTPTAFSLATDCNGMGGNYSVVGSKISFTQLIGTQMYCAGSQESEFTKMIQAVTGYHFTSRGELVLEFKTGTATFK